MRRSIFVGGILAGVLAGCGSTVATVVATNESAVPLSDPSVYKVPSGSMEPTLVAGERVIVTPTSKPRVGQIVVFYPPEEAEHELCGPSPHHVIPGGKACDVHVPRNERVKYIKRIVAGPGDELYIKGGHVFRKQPGASSFVHEPDPYTRRCEGRSICDFPTPIKVPRGQWYLLGDNRGESDDSRFWGPVPTRWIIGVAQRCKRIGLMCVATE